jgi:methyltransferase (TIGR00027 family)
MSWATMGELSLEQKGRSITAEVVTIQQALHQTLDAAPKILDDPIATLLIDPAGEIYQATMAFNEAASRLVKWPPFRTIFNMRSRYTEDCLAESCQRGVRQYAILGAVLDTFAYCQPEWANALRIYEVDHPASQEWKRARLAAAHVTVPENVVFAPIDFETTSLQEGLTAARFHFGAITFLSLLGVTQYLTASAIDELFQFARSLRPGSEIVFEIIVPDDLMPNNEATVFAAAASGAAQRDEPWLTRLRPTELQSKLTGLGFSQVTHLSPDSANERYFRERRDALAAWSGVQMMRAIV